MESTLASQNEQDMYQKRKEHWESKDSSIKSVLGGSEITQLPDVKASNELLTGLILTKQLIPNRVIDCGSGIGRVTEHVLLNFFNEIDLMEQSSNFIATCKTKFALNEKVKNIYHSSLQHFNFEREYDLIWIQWCLENIEDGDLNCFLKKCHKALSQNGMMIVKENYYKGDKEKDAIYAELDLSKQRSDSTYLDLFKNNGFVLKKHFLNPNWPSDFMPLVVYVLAKCK